MKKEFYAFLNSILFLTRIPISKNLPFSQEILNRASKYFPLIGFILGVSASVFFYFINSYLSKEISIVLLLSFFVLITGAFHEDGLADFFDGFWGGFDKKRILEIMKDSRIGTYGTIALILSFLLKFYIYLNIIDQIILLLPLSQSISRISSISFINRMNYASENGKTKPLAKSVSTLALTINTIFFLSVFYYFFPTLLPYLFFSLILFHYVFKKFLLKKIGGYTGDCLGAAQQLSEILILLLVSLHGNI
jgi:adenosylcobinamide-GDP ribazoletransferase